MKKVLSILFVTVLLIFSLSMMAFAAAPSASLAASSGSVAAGDSITVTVKVSGCSSTSLGIIPSYDTSAFDLTSGKWLVSGAAMSDFSDGCAVIAYADKYNFNGKVFEFVLKAKSNAKIDKYTVKCEVQAEGYSAVNPSCSISVACKNHSFSAWTVTKEATCTKKGSQSRTCSVCGKTETKEIPALGHKVDHYDTTKEATCTEDGLKVGTCSVCGEKVEKKIKATGHDYDKGVVTKEATESEDGILTKTCKACGKTKEEKIPKKSAETSKEPVTEPTEPSASEPDAPEDSSAPSGDTSTDTPSNDTSKDVFTTVSVPLWLLIVIALGVAALSSLLTALITKKKS